MKKKLLLSIACGFSVVTIVTCLSIASNLESFSLRAQANNNYAITFNSTNNKFHSYTGNTGYDGTSTIKTNLGNDVEFDYYQIKGVASTWHVLGDGGYFFNTTPILGIESIDLSFKTDGASYSIYYSYDNSFSNHVDFVSSTASNTFFDFNGFKSYYFKILNTSGSNFNISSITLRHSCLNGHPSLYLSSGDDVMGSVTGGGIKTAGVKTTITASPNLGYRFVGWYDNKANLVSESNPYSFNMPYENLEYTARFTYKSYNLVIQSESSEKGTVSNSSGSYLFLSEITVSAEANDGYTFDGWYENNSLISTNNPFKFTMPSANKTYTAKFTTNSYDLILNNQNPALGSVSGAGSFLYKNNVSITASPNTGVSFLGWYDSNDALVSISNPYVFTMPHANLEYTAKFEWTPYFISLSVDDENKGSVNGAGYYTYQQEITLVATPNEHCSFFGWYDGSTLVSQQSTYTFNMPNHSLDYEARFVNNHYLYIYSDDTSKGTVIAPTEWGEGLDVTIDANAIIGYALNYWYDDDLNEVSYDPSYTFVMPNYDVTLYASFDTGYTMTATSSDITKGTVTGSNQYKAGRIVEVEMNYISGVFAGWYDSNDTLLSKQNPYSFTMPSNNYSIEARFMTLEEEVALGITPVVDLDKMTVTYGLYPQKNVNDSSLISSLNSISKPESNGWYLYNGTYYAKMIAKPFNDNLYKFDNGTTITKGTTYWFKCEPITWKILSNNNGEYYLLSSLLLDAHIYHSTSNNYKNSEIRSWLNNGFYNSAFALGNGYIRTTTVDNSASTTESSTNPYACANTYDKVFLPSYKDYKNSSYGFSNSNDQSTTRCCKTTDWARANGSHINTSGTYKNNGLYLARSPVSTESNRAWYIHNNGELMNNVGGVSYSYHAVRIAITLVF